MPINSFISQPGADALQAAYNPVLIRVTATATGMNIAPPVVYCDIYFGGIYYKSLSKTIATLGTEYEFDIQDAAQEAATKFLAPNGFAQILDSRTLLRCFCRFRSSGKNADGFTIVEDSAPVQATTGTAAVPGTGSQSNTFYIINAALQNEDNPDLASHLNAYKKGAWYNAYPLTHRPDTYRKALDDSDAFPFVYLGTDLPVSIRLNYRFVNQNTFHQVTATNLIQCPAPLNIQTAVADNGNGTQTLTFTFDAFSSAVTGLAIGYRLQGSTGNYTSVTGSAVSPQSITMPVGTYEIQFIAQGSCIANPVTLNNVGVPPDPCTPVATVGTPQLPDGSINADYIYSIGLTGTRPFSLSNIVKPSWMVIFLQGTSIFFRGRPLTPASNVPVSFRVSNCYGGQSVDVASTINITSVATTNAINILIQPGFMDTGIQPQSCWQWIGTVSVKQGGVVLATQTWNSHNYGQQSESLLASGLTDGNYTVEWSLTSVQGCTNRVTQVDYVFNGGAADAAGANDSRSFNVFGGTTQQIELTVNNG